MTKAATQNAAPITAVPFTKLNRATGGNLAAARITGQADYRTKRAGAHMLAAAVELLMFQEPARDPFSRATIHVDEDNRGNPYIWVDAHGCSIDEDAAFAERAKAVIATAIKQAGF